jgi:hypothetical protein
MIWKRFAVVAVVALSVLLAGCGSQDTSLQDSSEQTQTTVAVGGEADLSESDLRCERIDPSAVVTGQVWHDVVPDATQSATGEPGLGGLVVVLEDLDGEAFRIETAEDGSFEFLNVDQGSYSLWLDPDSVPAGFGFSIAPRWHFKVLPGDHLAIPGFGIARTGTISGRVFQDVNNDGVRDLTEEGLGEVVIWAASQGLLGSPAVTETDSSGWFSLEVLPGEWELDALRGSIPVYWESSVPKLPFRVKMAEGQVIDDLTFGYYQARTEGPFDPDPGSIPYTDPDPEMRLVGAAGDDPMAGSILSLIDRYCLTVEEARQRLTLSERTRGVAPVARMDADFAGIWLDNAEGHLSVAYTDNAETKALELEERFDLPKGTIVGVEFEYTLQELRDVQAEISALLEENGIENWISYVAEPENRLYVTVPNPDQVRALLAGVYPDGMVHLGEGSAVPLGGLD